MASKTGLHLQNQSMPSQRAKELFCIIIKKTQSNIKRTPKQKLLPAEGAKDM